MYHVILCLTTFVDSLTVSASHVLVSWVNVLDVRLADVAAVSEMFDIVAGLVTLVPPIKSLLLVVEFRFRCMPVVICLTVCYSR